MDSVLTSTLLKLAVPSLLIVVVLVVTRLRGFSWPEELGLAWPRPSIAAGWLVGWIGWMALGELLIRWVGMEQPAPWQDYPFHIVVLRIAAIGLAGPAAEEMVMRGALLGRLRRTALGPAGAIVLVAAFWAVMHYRYDWATILLIFADGIVLGASRQLSRSLWVPIAMHSMGNLFSIYQSLSA